MKHPLPSEIVKINICQDTTVYVCCHPIVNGMKQWWIAQRNRYMSFVYASTSTTLEITRSEYVLLLAGAVSNERVLSLKGREAIVWRCVLSTAVAVVAWSLN